jgi:exopolysaccharide production protein ExoZ
MLYSVHALRLLAALGVVAHHSATRFSNPSVIVGAAGVDLFFIISGIVISLSTKPDDAVSDFCVKRFIRVVPLYWIATAAILALDYWVGSPAPARADIARSLFFIPLPNSMPLYPPAWTLTFEMMFYAVFAILLGMLRRDVTLIAALVMVALSAAYLPIFGPPESRLYTDFCIEFAFGLTLAAALKRGLRVDPPIGAACIILAVALFVANSTWTPIRVLGWGIPSLLLVIGATSFESSPIFRNRIIVFGGAASYALYLFHVTALNFVNVVAAKNGLMLDRYPVSAFVVFVISSVVAGAAIHWLVEAPMLRWLRTVYRRMIGDSETPLSAIPPYQDRELRHPVS